MRTWRQSMVLAVALMSVAGCAARSSATRTATIDRNFCPKATATLYVTNDNWLDVVVYVLRGGSRFRLGEVTSIQSAVFRIPDAALGGTDNFAILADPIGSFNTSGRDHGYATGAISLQPGHTVVDLRVANILDHSSYSYGVEGPEIS